MDAFNIPYFQFSPWYLIPRTWHTSPGTLPAHIRDSNHTHPSRGIQLLADDRPSRLKTNWLPETEALEDCFLSPLVQWGVKWPARLQPRA